MAARRRTSAAFAGALAQTLDSAQLEPAFKAQMLALPSEADIANMLGRNVDPDLVQRARDQVRAHRR
jgi:aminopeptidase N